MSSAHDSRPDVRDVVQVRHDVTDGEAWGRLLLELAARITGTLDLQEVLDESLGALRELVDFGGGAIQLIEDDHLVAHAADPELSPEARKVRIPVGAGISGGIAASGKAEYVADITVDPRVPEAARQAGTSGGVRSYFGVPLIVQGFPIGVLQIDSTAVDGFTAADRAMVLAFTPTITAAVQNAQHFERERELAGRLLAADQLKRDFISVVSHELRTPLTIMQGMSSTLVQHADQLSTTQVRDLAGRSNTAARRLGRLIDDLLYAADLDRGFLGVQRVPCDLTAIVTGLAAEREAAVTPLTVTIEGSLPKVLGDPDRIYQVAANLIGNAEKHGGTDAPVHVTVAREGGWVKLAVADNGPGIAREDRDAIFELFFQSGDLDTRAAGGLGIGLYVVKRLCDAMDAKVEVGETTGGGTTFTVLFRGV